MIQFWLGPALGFMALIVWTLDTNDNLCNQLQKQGLLLEIINQLKRLSVEAIQELIEVRYICWLDTKIKYVKLEP